MTNAVALSFVALQVICGDPGGWKFSESAKTLESGVEELTIALDNAKPARPPQFRVMWKMPQTDMPHLWRPSCWTPGAAMCSIPVDWDKGTSSSLTSWAPVYSLFNDANENRLALAADDATRPVGFKAAIREEDCCIHCDWTFFETPAPVSTNEVLRLRFDSRKVFWSDALAEASAWISARPGREPLPTPSVAHAPLYSTWYDFHQNVFAADIEAECALAARLGMKTLIVDDGWQTDDTNRGYDWCGDWEVSKSRFPDMADHVRKVHDLGMKYMVWYSVPFVGVNAKAAERFRGKFLREPKAGAAGVLDPRFPDVREYLAGIYEKAMREWDIDGFKLDFIDAFKPAAAERPDGGRDIASVTEAVDVLMTDVARRLRAIKPEVLVEFRQSYIGPGIRKYGNMFRVGDCPGDRAWNRQGIARLRLTSGSSAVHSDMLEWHPSETAESAALSVLNAIFGTVQYSMMLRTLPADHLAMIRHWIAFAHEHEAALLHGTFRPCWPQYGCPLLVGESVDERVIGVYGQGLVADVAAGKTTFVLNATQGKELALRLDGAAAIEAFDTFGKSVGTALHVDAGLREVACPPSGYLRIRR